MHFSLNKQNGFVSTALWIAVLIGYLSITAINSNRNPIMETSKNSETYKPANLKDTVRNEVTGLSITDEE